MAPGLSAQKLVVKVLSKTTVAQRVHKDGSQRVFEHVLVADDSGAMLLNAHDELCAKLIVGQVVELHNVRVKLVNECMRLTMDKWASVHASFRAIPQPVQSDPNFSQVVYRQLSAGS